MHYYEFDESFVFEGETHDFWEMVYVDHGCVEVCRDEERITLCQGEIVFHRPNEFHSIRALNSSPNFFVISFVSSSPAMVYFKNYHTRLDKMLKPFISAIIREAEATFFVPKNDPTPKALIKRENAIIGGEQFLKTYLEQLLILLIRDINKISKSEVFPNKESMESHLITSIKDYVEKHLEAKITIADICKKTGYSKSYLCKIFKEQTGDTIADYAVRAKINRAKELIRKNELNFSEISDTLSFDNPQYFSRVFKRITKMSPTEFRETLILKDK